MGIEEEVSTIQLEGSNSKPSLKYIIYIYFKYEKFHVRLVIEFTCTQKS